MSNYKLKYSRFGAQAILIEWPAIISRTILNDIIAFENAIELTINLTTIELILGYHNIMVIYDEKEVSASSLINSLKSCYKQDKKAVVLNYKCWTVPVCYDNVFAIDIEALKKKSQLTHQQIISLHSSAIYDVHFVGFLPGFLYLGGLDSVLHLPRKSTPERSIPKGAVAIGGQQTGIYPMNSPGGWHVIGQCPISLFELDKDPPCKIKAGDQVQFRAISYEEYQRGNFKLKLND